MRHPLLARVILLAFATACLGISGCDAGREENNPFAGIDHDYRSVGTIDTTPGNGR